MDANVVLDRELGPHLSMLGCEVVFPPYEQEARWVGCDFRQAQTVISPWSSGVVDVAFQPPPPLINLLESLIELLSHAPLLREEATITVSCRPKRRGLQFDENPFPGWP